MNEFKVQLPIVAGAMAPDSAAELRDFFISKPTVKAAREYYKAIRKKGRLLDGSQDRAKYESQLDVERLELMKADPDKRDEARLKEIADQYNILAEQKDDADVEYFNVLAQIAFSVLDTQLSFNQIDWDNADPGQIQGAIDFFGASITKSSYDPKS